MKAISATSQRVRQQSPSIELGGGCFRKIEALVKAALRFEEVTL
jgi:hypothetical protein